MGDRGNIVIDDGGKRVWLYAHWSGTELPAIVHEALKRGKPRWRDASYLARIVFCELVQANILGETGYGISTEPGDNEWPFLVLDVDKQQIYSEADTRDGFGYGSASEHKVFSFEDYVAHEGPFDWGLLASEYKEDEDEDPDHAER